MYSFRELTTIFDEKFNHRHFPEAPASLYDAAQYILSIGGKRIRPVVCLMGNELFDDITPDAYHVATAFELFHNFTLLHDDIMDKAPLRRGKPTVHEKFSEPAALLAGDVMLVRAYEYLNKIEMKRLPAILQNFSKMAKQVCEGQQLDMDFETRPLPAEENGPAMKEYIDMIALKTSVLLGAALRCGAILGGAGSGNQQLIYNFGRSLGIAFQVQDDYLDAFGDPEKFGKQGGGDILANKKTFLLLHAMEAATAEDLAALKNVMQEKGAEKVKRVLEIYERCNVRDWALQLKNKYMDEASAYLEEIAVVSSRKKPLEELAAYLLTRES